MADIERSKRKIKDHLDRSLGLNLQESAAQRKLRVKEHIRETSG